MHTYVNNWPKVVTWKWNSQESQPQPFELQVQCSNHYTTMPHKLDVLYVVTSTSAWWWYCFNWQSIYSEYLKKLQLDFFVKFWVQ